MPTLEILKLQLKPGISPTSPRLLSILSAVRDHVQTKSRFYTCIEDSSLLYILGEWPSLDAHKAFLSSPDRERILSPQDELADFVWCSHMQIAGSMRETLPLEAAVISLARLWIKPDAESVGKFQELAEKYHDEVVTGSAADVVGSGWRADPAAEGEGEYIVFSGWESRRQHEEFTETTRRDVPGYAGMRKYYDVTKGERGMEVVHLRDVERMVERGESV